jgi:hypothetical protein
VVTGAASGIGRQPGDNPHGRVVAVDEKWAIAEIAEPVVRRHAIVARHGPYQPNVPIQPAMARPISSGESS